MGLLVNIDHSHRDIFVSGHSLNLVSDRVLDSPFFEMFDPVSFLHGRQLFTVRFDMFMKFWEYFRHNCSGSCLDSHDSIKQVE